MMTRSTTIEVNPSAMVITVNGTEVCSYQMVQRLSPSRMRIIKEYLKLRGNVERDTNIIRLIAKNLGYTVDKNRSNDFVRRVLKEFFEEQEYV